MKIKTNKLIYYLRNFSRQLVPKVLYENELESKLRAVEDLDPAILLDRINYYNKLKRPSLLEEETPALEDLQIFKRPREYKFDAFEYTRYFSRKFRTNFLFGDVRHAAKFPTIQKSRPIAEDNTNAILLKLNKARHFIFVKDERSFSSKKNMLIGRHSIYQQNRIRFMDMYFDHPLCDIGQVNNDTESEKWLKPRISIDAHLRYKFILSLEGNDVATNLKWIMSSNSIAVMPMPKYETWFMEGRLVPDFHYIMIKDDFSDLEEKLEYYIDNEDEAQAIISNANKHVQQFLDKRQEDIISLMVLKKYFYCTMQTDEYELL
jgi:hypothetical protein